MKDEDKTKAQLIRELAEARQKNTELARLIDRCGKTEIPSIEAGRLQQQGIPAGGRGEGLADKSQELFYNVFNASPASMIICALEDGRVLEVNENFTSYSGYRREEMIGRRIMEFNLWKDPEQRAAMHRTVLQQGAVYNLETTMLTKTGEFRVGLYSAHVIELNAVKCILGVMKDITDRKMFEEEKRRSAEKYKFFVENSDAGLIFVRTDGMVEVINKKAASFLGGEAGEMAGKSIDELLPRHVADNWLGKINKAVTEEKGILERETRVTNGQENWFIKYFYPIKESPLDNKPVVQIIIRDISDYIMLENKIARLDRMDLIGQMAAGIGHELRNPMTTVRGLLQIIGAREEFFKYKEHFNIMIGELDRANSIITEFLSLAKNKPAERKVQNLNAVLDALIPLITADAVVTDKHINLDFGSIPDLLLEEKEIRQLILNLVRNGLEAMLPGGILTIRTFTDNGEVVLAVQDQGKEIQPEIIEKMGTPFFTTKDNGTGLGLAICNNVAVRHNAALKIVSGAEGTTVFVRFSQEKNKD